MSLQLLGFTKTTESCHQQCSKIDLECTCKLPSLLCVHGTMLYHMLYHIPVLQKHRAHLQAKIKEEKSQPLGGLRRCHHRYPPGEEQPWPHTATCCDPATPLPDTSASNNPGCSQPAGASPCESLWCSISQYASVHFHLPEHACQLMLSCKAEKLSSCPRGPSNLFQHRNKSMLTTAASCVRHMQHETRVNAIAKLEIDTSMAGMRFIIISCMHRHTGT